MFLIISEIYLFLFRTHVTYDKYETAEEAYQTVIAEGGAGAAPRDKIDQRIINEVTKGTYTYGNNGIIDHPSDAEGFIEYKSGTPVTDNDRDGMDDEWEKKVGLDPTNPDDRNTLTETGYTALEVYLNSLVGENISHKFNKK